MKRKHMYSETLAYQCGVKAVHLELGHGSAHALARFFLAAMAFARELEEKPDAKAE